jgi:TolA-binding protein
MTVNWGNIKQSTPGEQASQKWLAWFKAHQEIVAVIGIIVILAGIGVPYYLHSQQQNEKDAQNVLNLGQMYLRMPIDPKNGFKSAAERNQQALQTFQRIVTDYPGTPTSKIARYYVAKTQYFQGLYTQSYASFDIASHELKETPLGPEAYFGKILSLEGQNLWQQAAAAAEQFLKENPDDYIVPQIRLNLADVYLKIPNKDKALEQLKITAKSFPDSDWAKEAESRLGNLNS